MNYVLPTIAIPKINGKELWRNEPVLVLGEAGGVQS